MSLMENFSKWREKKQEEKEEFKRMERELRFKKLLEEKQKIPMQKEHDFYQRERERESLKKLVEVERKQRAEKMKELSNPYKTHMFKEKNNLMRGGIKWV